MKGFLESLENLEEEKPTVSGKRFRIISNSIDLGSSERNIEISKKLRQSVIPFVGIHPQAASDVAALLTTGENLEGYFRRLEILLRSAAGLGEIGLDPKFGSKKSQVEIFQRQLQISETLPTVPISIHSRGTIKETLEILGSFNVSSKILFHWFAGTEGELSEIQSRGYYVSFGPTLIFSKRIQELARMVDSRLILVETDSPLFLESISKKQPLSPFAVSSVMFKIAEVRESTFDRVQADIEENANEYLQAQSSLRVSKK
jgi:TatD DNase family protein